MTIKEQEEYLKEILPELAIRYYVMIGTDEDTPIISIRTEQLFIPDVWQYIERNYPLIAITKVPGDRLHLRTN
jgi:hypothetical protein